MTVGARTRRVPVRTDLSVTEQAAFGASPE